ncbi:MAG TPA: hypothetical protein VJY12_06360 [Dysgonamonadaceae bacterium]|nr:hypothetical protein [Dysgonamonadaceae bacterium]
MNKYQESIHEIETFVRNKSEVIEGSYQGQFSLNVLQELVDKETPMSVSFEATKREDATCPMCKNVVSDTIQGRKAIPPYCMFCGQKIDW